MAVLVLNVDEADLFGQHEHVSVLAQHDAFHPLEAPLACYFDEILEQARRDAALSPGARDNDAPSIETWLDGKAGHLQVELKPTTRYHEAVAEAAYVTS